MRQSWRKFRQTQCMHQGDSACRRVQEDWTWTGSSCNSSAAICLAMRAGVPAYLAGCVVSSCAVLPKEVKCASCACLLKKMHALQRAERGRCGSAWPCHMLSFPKSRKTHVTKNNTKHCCTKLLVILVRQIFGRVSDGAVSGMAFLDDDSELAEDATRG